MTRSDAWRRYPVAGALYLLASVAVWWNAWARGPSSVMTCACTDAGRTLWYLEWPAYALTHGHNLLYSTWLFHPGGFGLLSDTSIPAVGLIAVPITLLFGAVVSINLADTLIPVVTALSMYWLLRRWVRWTPAAFIGGLAYGFSAYVLVQLAFGWLNLALVGLLPLMVACADELFIRQRVGSVRVGIALGLLVTIELFVSIEMVLIVAVSGLVAVALLVGYAAVSDAGDLRRRLPHALSGSAVAAGVAMVLLAYPVWLFVAGPGHLSGMLWPTSIPGDLGNTFGNFWSHLGTWGPMSSRQLAREAPVLGGYRGPPLPSPSYLGAGWLGIAAIGVLRWRRDRRLWCFGGIGLVTALVTLRVGGGEWGPWALVYHLPFFQDVIQSRFSAVVDLCAAVMLAVIVDRTRTGVGEWQTRRRTCPQGAAWFRRAAGSPAVSVALAAAVAAVAIVPVAGVMAANLPLTVQALGVPRWFVSTAPHLPAGQVLATYPFATADSQSSIPWQAIDKMHYLMAGGGGPAGTITRAGAEAAGFSVLRSASVVMVPPPAESEANLQAVRQALRHWGVTMVVVPDDGGLAAYQQGRGTLYGVAFFTAVLGSAPSRQPGAWVWSEPGRAPPPRPLSGAELASCIDAGAGGRASS
ncbi:MAG: hypothetical protein ACYCV7_13690, partial [Acidimicrobiales bacterium]